MIDDQDKEYFKIRQKKYIWSSLFGVTIYCYITNLLKNDITIRSPSSVIVYIWYTWMINLIVFSLLQIILELHHNEMYKHIVYWILIFFQISFSLSFFQIGRSYFSGDGRKNHHRFTPVFLFNGKHIDITSTDIFFIYHI